MRLLILIVALLAPAAFGLRIKKPLDNIIIPFFNEADKEAVVPSDMDNDAGETRAIPAGSCGVNKYGTFYDVLFQPYIVGGTTTQPNQYPWQVSLQRNGAHTCGGTIYNQQYILTAAHCFTGGNSASSWTVVAGKHQLTKSESTQKSYSVSAIIKHEKYSMLTNANDVALMKLSSKITYTDEIQPICMPSGSSSYEGVSATVTGWGATREGGSAATTLQQVNVPVISNTKCQQKYSRETITSGMLCAGYDAGGKDSCQGDSGGPLVVKEGSKWTQIGVVSWGYGCAQANAPGVYTRVTEYLPWIKSKAV